MKLKIGLGCSKLGNYIDYRINYNKYHKILQHSYKRGIQFYDTANIYRNGNSEIILGKYFLKKKKVFSTKFGYEKKKFSFILKLFNLENHYILKDYEEMKVSVFKSLERLGINYIDILFWHSSYNFTKLQMSNAFKTLNFFKKNGILKFSGISLSNVNNIKDIIDLNNFDYLQISLKDYLLLSKSLKNKIIKKKIKLIINQFFYNLNLDKDGRDKHISKHYNLLKKEKNIDYILIGTNNTKHLDYFLNFIR